MIPAVFQVEASLQELQAVQGRWVNFEKDYKNTVEIEEMRSFLPD